MYCDNVGALATYAVELPTFKATSGGPDTEACPTSKNWDYCCQDFAAELVSRDSGFADTAGSHTSGLGYGSVLLIWH